MTVTDNTTRRLKAVHPELAKVYRLAASRSNAPPAVTSDPRTLAEQKKLVAKGASQTTHSRHLPDKDGFVYAIDVCFIINGKMDWSWPLYAGFAKLMKAAAKECRVPVEWGGDWRTFKDGPHFQLPWKQYPGRY